MIFVMVAVGDYCGRGADYVRALASGIRRHVPRGAECRIVVATDEHGCWPVINDLCLGLRGMPLDGLSGWWAKLALFRPQSWYDTLGHALLPGERIVYLDLDTIVMGDLAPLYGYGGEFALLRDFYRPEGYGSGAMLWRAGFGAHIWESWCAAGRPELPGGDQEWIERAHPGADRLQDVLPGMFASFKVGAETRLGGPPDAPVVCFHGRPKPHEIGAGWVPQHWVP